MNTVIEFLNQTSSVVYAYVDQTRPILTLDILVLKNAFLDAKKRGVKLWYITEITKDNLSYCKQLLTMVDELRHLDRIKGNFYISESGYLAPATLHERGKPASQIIYSNVNEIIDHQKYVFDSFWDRAIPAEDRIREVEEDINLGKTEIIQSPNKILELFLEMIKTAKHEILLILPTINAFLREERIGTFELLRNLALMQNVNVRIITPTNEAIEIILQNVSAAVNQGLKQQEVKNRTGNFQAQRSNIQFKETTVTTVTILVVDRKVSLAIEKTDDSKLDFIEAIGLTTYSDSEPTVMSYVSIFEGLWKQAELVDQLEAHDRMQREFINIASHEMKTPTQAILGTSALLKYYPERKDELIEIIQRNAKRLQTLIGNILDVTRIESQMLLLNKVRFDIRDLISSVLEDYKDRTKDSNIKLSIKNNNNNNPIFVEADRDRIIQVLSNLLSNAIKFTNQGEISITLFEKIQEEEDGKTEVLVSVTDTGSGINSEIFGRLFSKFASKSYQGTGLGLFICKSIIQAHDGRIWAENNNNSGDGDKSTGATITFSLPTATTVDVDN